MFKKLKGKIREVYNTQEAFSKAMGISKTSLNERLKGRIDWKATDIVKACELLEIPKNEAHEYFF